MQQSKRYRVECNFGSRYFKDSKKAENYFNKCMEKSLDAELWLVTYLYCPLLDKFAADQELLEFTGTRLPVH